VLGGTQSLHTDAFDEALALPTEDAARIALRTQQILAFESGVANPADPLGGSYFVEKLTLDMEKGAQDYFSRLDAMGGMVRAIERGFPQREIAEASYAYQRAIEAGEKIIVGVNEHCTDEQSQSILYIGEEVRESQSVQLKRLRSERSNETLNRALDQLCRVLEQEPQGGGGPLSDANTMPFILDCVRSYGTVGEICNAMSKVLGSYEEIGTA
jgi:methylmalonyl-CoA mutase N-terminal domain/subunit